MGAALRRRAALVCAVLLAALLAAVVGTGFVDGAAAVRGGTVVAPSSVVSGGSVLVRGKVPSGQHARPVRFFEKRGSGWVRLRAGKTTKTGAFRFTVGSGTKLVTRTFQVRAPKTSSAAAVTTRLVRVRVVPPGYATTTPPPAPLPVAGAYDPPAVLPATEPRPLGSTTDWAWVMNEPSRWNPCQVITWAYNPAGSAYAGALADLRAAMAELSVRSGLRFRYVGTTTALGGLSRPNPAGVGIVAGWTDAAHEDVFAHGMAGLGGAVGNGSRTGSGFVLAAGFLLLNNGKSMPGGFTTSGAATWGQLITHELMHALGLGHAAGSGQLMYPTAWSGNHRFGAGDLAGLAQVGSAQGCWS